MPLISPTNPVIRVTLTDRVFDNTTIKQEAIFSTLLHRQDESTGLGRAEVAVTVKSYSDANGSLGTHLHDKGMPDKTVYLVADNDTVVDAATGAILAIKTDANRATWDTIVAGFEQDVMLQGDFFVTLRESQPIVIGDLIREHIAQADAMGKFA